MSFQKVIYNRDLFTHIVSYLQVEQLKGLVEEYRPLVHYDYIVPTKHTLMYGEVQSGKTGKIMDYIQYYMPQLSKLLVLQNSVFMLHQYILALKNRQISFKIINNLSKKDEYHEEQVILLINNKYRKNALLEYMDKNKYILKNFCLILDESDQYLRHIQHNDIFKSAKHVLHVTATPFQYKKFPLDKTVMLKPKNNYVGLKDVDFREMLIPNTHNLDYITDMCACIHDIIGRQFVRVPAGDGIMLITCFKTIVSMKERAADISSRHPSMPVIVITMNIYVYFNGVITRTIKKKNIPKLFDMFDNKNMIVIANRLSNRGINYTNSTYTRHITHQISVASNNYTSFIQKCRIFGVRNNGVRNNGVRDNGVRNNGMRVRDSRRPVLYCIKSSIDSYYDKLIHKIDDIGKNVTKKSVVNMRAICKEHSIKGYSKLRKNQLIELLQQHNIEL